MHIPTTWSHQICFLLSSRLHRRLLMNELARNDEITQLLSSLSSWLSCTSSSSRGISHRRTSPSIPMLASRWLYISDQVRIQLTVCILIFSCCIVVCLSLRLTGVIINYDRWSSIVVWIICLVNSLTFTRSLLQTMLSTLRRINSCSHIHASNSVHSRWLDHWERTCKLRELWLLIVLLSTLHVMSSCLVVRWDKAR